MARKFPSPDTAVAVETDNNATKYEAAELVPDGESAFAITNVSEFALTKRMYHHNGNSAELNCYTADVTFTLASNPDAFLIESYDFPPDDPNEASWFVAAAHVNPRTSQPSKMTGYHWKRLLHLIHALGWETVPGQKIPDAATDVDAWVGKKILRTVERNVGETKVDKTGKEIPGKTFVGFAMFTCKPFNLDLATQGSLPLGRPGQPAPIAPVSAPARPTGPAPIGRPAPVQPAPYSTDVSHGDF